MDDKLKPCPFCGRDVELRLGPTFGDDSLSARWGIQCSCAMGSPDVFYDPPLKDELIKAWNTRADDPRIRAEARAETIEECIDYLADCDLIGHDGAWAQSIRSNLLSEPKEEL